MCTFKLGLGKFPKFSFSAEISGRQELCAEVALTNNPAHVSGVTKIVTEDN